MRNKNVIFLLLPLIFFVGILFMVIFIKFQQPANHYANPNIISITPVIIKPPPIATIAPSIAPTLSPEEKNIKQSIISVLPIKTNEFDIEYIAPSNNSPDYFIVTIKESPFNQNQEKAKEWFIEHGVQNISDFPIDFRKYKWVQ